MVKKVIAFLMYLMAMVIVAMPLHSQDYKTEQRSKAIHVVYDDSGSMIVDDDNKYLDRWGQAKYAMEVFAVMLEEKDTMRVYYMSDFNTLAGGRVDAPPKHTISGSEPAEKRVSTIHDTVTRAGNTPYDAVAKAYADLRTASADEKWLVVLTDGKFDRLNGEENEDIDVDGFFSQYIGVKIILLAMGDDAAEITDNPGRDIHFEQARNSSEILGRITSMCNRIFNRNKLDFTNEIRHEVTFDIPMKELLIFAQGANVEIKGLKGANAPKLSETVKVRYSDVAATNFVNDPNVKKSSELTGAVATFRNIPKGTYTLDISGAQTGEQTVDVYYKPVVNLDIRLYQGVRETRTQDITDGKYRIQYGIVNEDGKFFESKLLGTVKYEVTAVIDGQVTPIKSGDTITLKQGELKVNVKARFLDINTAESDITRNVNYIPLLQKILNWLIAYWPLPVLLLVVLLWWLLWGRKKRFPKYMRGRPLIIVENDETGRRDEDRHSGYFRLIKKTKWLPLCSEKGRIGAAADGKPLPALKVEAAGDGRMKLTNARDFWAEKLGGQNIGFYIDGQPLREPTQEREMSCGATLRSEYYDAGSKTTHTCSFNVRNKKRRK